MKEELLETLCTKLENITRRKNLEKLLSKKRNTEDNILDTVEKDEQQERKEYLLVNIFDESFKERIIDPSVSSSLSITATNFDEINANQETEKRIRKHLREVMEMAKNLFDKDEEFDDNFSNKNVELIDLNIEMCKSFKE
ncbi:hypothetical protein O3M35_000979 [Rhynocoris fuscipes]|uniref:Uncharacterized protein n=1 Tax=Rhynocoris fuscipes TaxID=488301 RepID=A0AAW1DQQ2_9HEMI